MMTRSNLKMIACESITKKYYPHDVSFEPSTLFRIFLLWLMIRDAFGINHILKHHDYFMSEPRLIGALLLRTL